MGRKKTASDSIPFSLFSVKFPYSSIAGKKKNTTIFLSIFLASKSFELSILLPCYKCPRSIHGVGAIWGIWLNARPAVPWHPMGWGQCRGFLKHTVDWRKNFSDVVQYLSHPAKVQTFLSWVGDNFLSKLHLTWILHWRSPKVSLMEGCLLNVVLFVHLWNTCMCMQMHAHIWCMSKNNNVWLKKTNYIVTMLELNPVTFSLIYSENGSPDTNSFFLIQP